MKYTVSIISFVLISITCFAQEYPTWMFNNQPSCAVGISLPTVQDSDFAEDISVLVANFAYGLSNKKYNQAKQVMNSKFIDGEYRYESALQIQIVHPQVDSIKKIKMYPLRRESFFFFSPGVDFFKACVRPGLR